MPNLFHFLPSNFFSPLSSVDKEIYSDILFLIYFKSDESNSYTFSKDELLDLIEDYFITNNKDITEDEEHAKTARDKATYIFRRLKACGWLDTEYTSNQQIIVNLEDHAIALLNTYANFNETNSFELSSYVYGIYQNMKTFDITKGYLTLSDTVQKSKTLINKLRSLNSNIKKYIKNVIKINNTNAEENLQKILENLLSDYKINVIDKAYFYMKTNDNPLKYKHHFLELCKRRREELESNIIISQIKEIDNLSSEEAILKFEEIMVYLESAFNYIIDIMEEIDRKNTKYISVSIERIKIILNNDSNVEGMLLNILKKYELLNQNDLTFNISNLKQLANNSLYTTRKIKKTTPVEFQKFSEVTQEQENIIKNQIKEKIKYSKSNIHKYINQLLEKKEKLSQADFNLANKEEFIKLLLAFIYANDDGSQYQINWLENKTKINQFLIPKFTIERREKK